MKAGELRLSIEKSAKAALQAKPDISKEELTGILRELYINGKKEVPLTTVAGIVMIPLPFPLLWLLLNPTFLLFYGAGKMFMKSEKSKKEIEEIIKAIVFAHF
jgi:hypothetical protein